MKRKIKYYRLILLKHDIPAGITVFLVALPLCLGIALASNAPLYAGILSGVIGGIIVPIISRSSLSVSGPAAGLTTLVAAAVTTYGSYEKFLVVVIIAGVFQILLGTFKLGQVANFFPSSVIKGMLAAIGLILISKQLPIALGYTKPDFWSNTFGNIFDRHEFFEQIQEFPNLLTPNSVIITIFSLAIMIFWKKPIFEKFKIIPAPLVVVVLGILIQLLFREFFSDFSLNDKQLVKLPNNLFGSLKFPDWSVLNNKRIYSDGIIIGLLASLETLLCTEAIDKLDPYNRLTPVNRELVAQGVGNIACGLLGAIPITAVIVRGSANVEAGGRSKLSAVIHGLFLLASVLTIPFVINQIPYASLSAILLVTGYNLAKPRLFNNTFKLGWQQFLPFVITILFILLTDLLVGVSIGLLLSIYFIIRNNFKADYHLLKDHHQGLDYYTLKLNTNVTFLNKVKLKSSLEEIPEYAVAIIDGSDCNFIDYDVLEIFSEFENKARHRHIELELKGIKRVTVEAVH